MKKTIEIDDVLEEQTDSAIDDIKAELLRYLDDNEPDTLPDWGDLDYSGTLHEIIDGAVPVYTQDIEAAWFLYGRELEEAYSNAGLGDNPRENDGAAAIYCYIEAKAQEWWRDNAEDVFEEWQTKHNAAEFFCALAEKLGVTEDQAKALWAAVDMPPDERERREQEGAAGGEEEAERMAAAGA